MPLRPVAHRSAARATREGAGVHLHRAFGFGDTARHDPFLLLDDFRNDRPGTYEAGFPWHPHRGMETITYVLAGTVEHGDSLGNQGVIGPGDVQWMTAGNGIIHQEMPHGDEEGRMWGFQLWANLPAGQKRTRPHYQEIPAASIPAVELDGGARVRVVCGRLGDVRGPVEGIAVDPLYLDVSVPAGAALTLPSPAEHQAFAYVFEGSATFEGDGPAGNRTLVTFGHGDSIAVTAGPEGTRFLLVSGRPLREPVAWHGPIVMNTDAELRLAFEELQSGDFLKPPA